MTLIRLKNKLASFLSIGEYPISSMIIRPMAGNLENKIIFKAGEKNIELAFADIVGEVQTRVSSSTSAYSGKTETSSRSHKVFSAKLIITNELEKALITEKKIGMRIYFGTEPSTYKIEGDDLLKIKNFLLSTPEKIADEKPPKAKDE